MLPEKQAAEMRFLRKVHGVMLREKLSSCELFETLNVKPLRTESFQLRWFIQVTGMAQARCPAGYTHGIATKRATKDQVMRLHPTWFGSVLVWSQQNYQRLLETVTYFGSS